jgi:hypothetical protein
MCKIKCVCCSYILSVRVCVYVFPTPQVRECVLCVYVYIYVVLTTQVCELKCVCVYVCVCVFVWVYVFCEYYLRCVGAKLQIAKEHD